ncbi:TonB-dependent receptor [Thalassotalea sp. 1_MG-2023]|uniref:TonB-dependent receptor domain-containing protein n=1 Tax=Thalassotalea sp. 1_MG-2023 TaxID=3062680 RepID=UPI0026E34B02|nr:TonB-dependent receptor [Thalassotalea sp. 1_MG-2023]MDO6426534.1 TonB-dependent receptor [Thalassotalea sp. 1_MG-2023]
MNNSRVSKAIKIALAFGAASALPFNSAFAAEEQNEEEQVERIQVTGSKIKRIGELAPTPVTVISGDMLINAGITNVADLLNEMPNSSVGLSPETTNNTIFASGLNNTDLRGLGSSKTLVLVNGRRFVAGAPGASAVDLNNIPTAMVERMEITTGGASAVYGSDAVAGVVNIITKKSFDGIAIDASTTRPFEDGGDEEYMSLTFGDEGERSSFIANISYAKQDQLRALDRDYMVNGPVTFANVDNVNNEDGIPERSVYQNGYGQYRLGYYSPTGDFFMPDGHYIFANDGSIRTFEQNGTLPASSSPGNRNTNYFIGDGDGYHFAKHDYLRTPLERLNVALNYSYEINDNHSMNFEMIYADTSAYGESSPAFHAKVLQADNAFFSQANQDFFAERGVPAFYAYLTTDGLGNRKYDQDRTTVRAALSFEGLINDNWAYDAYIQKGQVTQDTTWHGEMITEHFDNALDAVMWNGDIVCADRNDDGDVVGALSGCSPLNLWGEGLASEEALAYVSTKAQRQASVDQMSLGFTVSGDLFELPAGPVASAFTAEYREEKAKTTPDAAMQQGLIFGNQSDALQGEFDVTELAAEISVPLIAETSFAKEIYLELAYRYMDYSSTGDDSAWKIGLNYVLNDELRFRANMSRSVRAPNVSELFAPKGQTFASFADPCGQGAIDNAPVEKQANIEKNCRAAGIPVGWEASEDWRRTNHSGFILGNQDLFNEKADDVTIGFVYNPAWADGLGITVDYWKFDLEDEINYPSAATIVNKCYESESLENLYCGLLQRTAGTFEIDNFDQKPINSASSDISGADIEIAYTLDTEFGTFKPRLIATYLDERNFNDTGFAEDADYSHGEQARPRWKARFVGNYTNGDLSMTLSANYRHATVGNNEWDAEQNDYNEIPSYMTWDLTSRYMVTDDFEVRAGILNLFDREPPANPYSYDQGAYYDLFGQRLTLGVNYKF